VLGPLRRHRHGLHRFLAPLLRRTGLSGPLFRGYERLMAVGERGAEPPDEGLPVPPPHLRVVAVGVPPREGFLASGKSAATAISELFARSGLELASAGAMLDFGCGCGRILRHWRELDGTEQHGCDYNPLLISWAEHNLPHVRAVRNDLGPPAPYPAGRFDAIYAVSVFTHLHRDLQFAWMHDLVRILRGGGRLLFTTHGAAMAGGLLEAERERFDAGDLVVRFDQYAGSNLCNAFHPPSWVRDALTTEGLEIDLFQPGGAPGLGDQDVWIARKPDAGGTPAIAG
jgi:SAM-dependent methyltransferase